MVSVKGSIYILSAITPVSYTHLLTITGREKNVIILDNGKNVYPEEIETLISYIPNVTEVVVYQADNTIVAEVYSDAEGDKNEIMEQIKAEIAEVNKKLASYKPVSYTHLDVYKRQL